MLYLNKNKYETFHNFLNKYLHSDINKTFIFNLKYNNYIFGMSFEQNNAYCQFKRLVIYFEFTDELNKKYINKNIQYIISFYYDNAKNKIILRYNDNYDYKIYNNTVLNLNNKNINKIFNKINTNLQNISENTELVKELLNYDLENLTMYFEKQLFNLDAKSN